MFTVELPNLLRDRLAAPLPGRVAQRRYSHQLSYGRHCGPALINARRAAVLVLLRWDGQQWLVPLMKRSPGGIHSGQICFAGGGLEPGESVVDAALRECQEETGWSPARDAIVGRLTPVYVYASNNLVSCVVAATTEIPKWQPDHREVAELLEVPLRHLCSDPIEHKTEISMFGQHTTANCFRWATYDIWGATSMIISELKSVLQT